MDIISKIREEVPALNQKIYGRDLVYFDNAATIQKPSSVIEMINRMNGATNANIHRAVHKISVDATELYEKARENVRAFINAKDREEVIFTSGATMSLNLLANIFAGTKINRNDIILVSQAEHHSNIVPWQMLAQRVGASVIAIPLMEDGQLDMDHFRKLMSERVKLVSIAQISNVLGLVYPVKEIVEIAHSFGAEVVVDGAQGVVHEDVDVQELDCDYYVFSGHKLYAATGIGILYGKRNLLEELPPFFGGGDMVDTVSFSGTTYAELPLKYEAGTPNFVGAASFAPAIEFAVKMRDRQIEDHLLLLTDKMEEGLSRIEGLKIYGEGEGKIPLFSFSVEGVHHSDIAQLLDKMGIAVRSGLMCAEPLIDSLGQTGLVRASLAPYNTLQEVDYFFTSLNRAINMLR